jgi:hypothetical protein
MYSAITFSVAFGLIVWPFCLVSAQTAAEQTLPKLSPTEVLQNKDKLLNNPIVVEGVLENKGTNFFTNSQLVIKQTGADDFLIVRMRVPLETIRPPNDIQAVPTTKSDVLGKKVKLQGVLREETVKGVGRTLVLEGTQPPAAE